MWYLRNANSDAKFYLPLLKEKYLYGRTNSNDLILLNDTSISRTHGFLYPTKTGLHIFDNNSKYGTFMNNNIDENIQIESGKQIELRIGDKIRFGRLENVWCVEQLKIRILTSKLSKESLVEITPKIVDILNGVIVDTWSDDCTHLLMDELEVTIKVSQSLVLGIPITTKNYWLKFITSLIDKKNLPLCEDYLPNVIESNLNDHSLFAVNANRKRLFAGKIIVFMMNFHMERFRSVIELASGSCINLEVSRTKVNSLAKPEMIVIHDIRSTQSKSSQNINMIESYLQRKGLRMIPECEIGLAILHCSLEKFCNPNYKVTNNFLLQSNKLVVTQPDILEQRDGEHCPENDLNNIPEPNNLNITSENSPEIELNNIEITKSNKRKHSTVDDNTDIIKKKTTKKTATSLSESISIPDQQISTDNLTQKNVIACNRITSTKTNKSTFISKEKPIASEQLKLPTKQSRKRAATELLQDNSGQSEDEGNDDLFNFLSSPVIKRTKTNTNKRSETTINHHHEDSIGDEDDHIFDFKDKTTNNREHDKVIDINQTEKIKNKNTMLSEPLIQQIRVKPVKTNLQVGWTSKSICDTDNKIKDEFEGKIKRIEDCLEIDDSTRKWIDSIKNGFAVEVKFMNLSSSKIVTNDCSQPNNINKVKNFKSFVKQQICFPQKVILVTHENGI